MTTWPDRVLCHHPVNFTKELFCCTLTLSLDNTRIRYIAFRCSLEAQSIYVWQEHRGSRGCNKKPFSWAIVVCALYPAELMRSNIGLQHKWSPLERYENCFLTIHMANILPELLKSLARGNTSHRKSGTRRLTSLFLEELSQSALFQHWFVFPRVLLCLCGLECFCLWERKFEREREREREREKRKHSLLAADHRHQAIFNVLCLNAQT